MQPDDNKLFKTLTFLNPSVLKKLSTNVMVLIEQKLWAKVLFGMLLGVIFGILLSPSGPFYQFVDMNNQNIQSFMSWLTLPAKFFLKLIQMVIIPLIISSVILGLASTTDVAQMKKIGLKFSLFVFGTTVFSSFLGVALTSLFNPGKGLSLSGASPIGETSPIKLSLSPDHLLNILPGNPISSIVEGQMLDVVILSIIAGIAFLSIEKKRAESIMDLLEVIQKICMIIISWAMRLAPYAVFGMMAHVTSSTGLKSLQNMGLYVLVCFSGFLLVITFYTLLLTFIKKINPFVFLKKISTALLLAFSTSSSAATMPMSITVAEDELGVESSVARFLIPLGTTVNMAGSAIWHTSAIVFLAQVYNIELNTAQILFVVATSIGSAIGSPGVPGVGIGILAAVLVKVGIPIEGVSLIMGVDRIIDMGCTVVNVTGDITASKLFSKT